MPTVLTEVDPRSSGSHESVLRSYQVLSEVKNMLDRGDSSETIRAFIAWVEDKP
jgi:hypothetical protein